MKRISEVAKNGRLDVDEFVNINQILDKDLVIEELIERRGKFGAYVTIKAKLNGKTVGFNTGSSVLLKAFKKVKEKGELPIVAKISKVRSNDGQYYYSVT